MLEVGSVVCSRMGTSTKPQLAKALTKEGRDIHNILTHIVLQHCLRRSQITCNMEPLSFSSLVNIKGDALELIWKPGNLARLWHEGALC